MRVTNHLLLQVSGGGIVRAFLLKFRVILIERNSPDFHSILVSVAWDQTSATVGLQNAT